MVTNQERDIFHENLRKNMRAIREDRGISQDLVALSLGVHLSTVRKWEAGWAYPTAVNLYVWCRLMHVEVDRLFMTDNQWADYCANKGIPYEILKGEKS